LTDGSVAGGLVRRRPRASLISHLKRAVKTAVH